MTVGTGPQAVKDVLKSNWQQSRTGRGDVPPLTTTPDQDPGHVRVIEDRQDIQRLMSTHDVIAVYHPQANAINIEDRGFKEQEIVETVQIDIHATDRQDFGTNERLNARDRMVGDRSDANFPTDESPPYPGLLGETKYILEEKRRKLKEWNVARHTVVDTVIKAAKAKVSLDVELEHPATNTVT